MENTFIMKTIVTYRCAFISVFQQSLKTHSDSFLHESQLLHEKDVLAKEKKLFYEEKAHFEEERKLFTEAAIKLGREVSRLYCFVLFVGCLTSQQHAKDCTNNKKAILFELCIFFIHKNNIWFCVFICGCLASWLLIYQLVILLA